jgi:DNA-binding transcriptional LysR family regulator
MGKTAKPVETGMFSKARIPYLSGLRYFYCVAKFGSFSAAAEALAIAPSAVNRQVASLEERLGERLFDRTRGRGGLQLTEVGAVLYAHTTAVMNELSVADEEINLLRSSCGEEVSEGRFSTGPRDSAGETIVIGAVLFGHRQTTPSRSWRPIAGTASTDARR